MYQTQDILAVIQSETTAGFPLGPQQNEVQWTNKDVSICVQPVIKGSKELVAGVRCNRRTTRTCFLMS